MDITYIVNKIIMTLRPTQKWIQDWAKLEKKLVEAPNTCNKEMLNCSYKEESDLKTTQGWQNVWQNWVSWIQANDILITKISI